ncbi:MAG: hypothetical protein JO167_06875 [Alphaproteobacteria bacterium]|nr:hypothetical protein [Alphaproteobacteria bacterium]
MSLFRAYLVVAIIAIVAYTVPVVAHHGLTYISVASASLRAMDWSGQFDIDFLFMLSLGGIWVAWRHAFSPLGLLLGLFAFLGGMPFLSGYLLYAIATNSGDMRKVLLGPSRA